MKAVNCIYLIPEVGKEQGGDGQARYRCLAGKVMLAAADLEEEWACAGCTIPAIMNAEHCLYLEPLKRFFNSGESVVVLMCSLNDRVLPSVAACHQCPTYTRAAPST
ncbi:MAG TPA: hypothetical protein GX518_02395 [Firmicutes bacterium]|nr:hypothetical protein [Bacillota bacterium]